MADGFVQVAPDSTGAKMDSSELTVGANVVDRQRVVLSDDSAAAGLGKVTNAIPGSTDYGLVTRSMIVGAYQAQSSGSITTSTTVVGGATNYGTAGNITVTFSGTYAGVNATFEVSDDSGTTWFSIQGQRVENGFAEATTGVLPANTIRAWNFSMLGYDRFRVRATAFTSGSATVRIDPGTMAFQPVVSAIIQPPARTPVFLHFQSTAPVVAETLVSVVKNTAYVAAAGATTIAPASGKVLRIISLALSIRATAATTPWASMHLRVNPTGAAVIGSPSIGQYQCGGTAAVIGNTASIIVPFADGIEISGTRQLGITLANNVTTNVASIILTGYEY